LNMRDEHEYMKCIYKEFNWQNIISNGDDNNSNKINHRVMVMILVVKLIDSSPIRRSRYEQRGMGNW